MKKLIKLVVCAVMMFVFAFGLCSHAVAEQWPANKYTALVPKPEGVKIISVSNIDSSRREGCEMFLAAWPLEQSKAYAEQVKKAGFTQPLNPGWDLVKEDANGWKFEALNSDGIRVNIINWTKIRMISITKTR